MRWQIAKYQQAVDEHRRRLSKSRHRAVGRAEAEEAFCEKNCEKLARQWRDEYCGHICEHRSTCPLANIFHSAA